jgi:hypothetical protein
VRGSSSCGCGTAQFLEPPCGPLRLLRLDLGRLQLGPDGAHQATVAGQPEHVFHRVFLAPVHQLIATKPRVSTQDDPGLGPASTDLRDQASNFVFRPGRALDIGTPQLRAQQMLAAEDIQRQVAIAVVVAVEEASLLVAVQRIVGRIQIQHDLAWIALVHKAARQSIDQTNRRIGPAQQQRARIRAHPPTIKRRHHVAPFYPCKFQLFGVTLCAHRISR